MGSVTRFQPVCAVLAWVLRTTTGSQVHCQEKQPLRKAERGGGGTAIHLWPDHGRRGDLSHTCRAALDPSPPCPTSLPLSDSEFTSSGQEVGPANGVI